MTRGSFVGDDVIDHDRLLDFGGSMSSLIIKLCLQPWRIFLEINPFLGGESLDYVSKARCSFVGDDDVIDHDRLLDFGG
ncbi:hypothetical protein Tco_0558816, partial [Tanacetum coccineum]